MSSTILTMAGLMASVSTLPPVEPSIVIVAQTDVRSIGAATNILTSGTSAAVDQIESSANASGSKWYLVNQAGYPDQTYAASTREQSPNLPVYLPSPTTAGALITIGSTLDQSQISALDNSTGQQPDLPTDEDVIVVTGPDRASPIDPLADINAEAFQLGQDFDRVLMAPVADAYKDALPKPARSAIRNFLNNLGEPIVFLNYLLQLKPGKAIETLSRFAVNSTIGIGGLIDVAKDEPFNLPHRRNGFANTLGYYGVDSGSYLYLPIIGATTVRDLVGDGLDLMVLPTAIGKPFNRAVYTAPAGVLRALDRRIELDDQIREIQEESADPYVAQREFYLKTRQMEIDILKGLVPDPLSRKSQIISTQGSKRASQFEYEIAELWYLPPKNNSTLASNSLDN
ncbi:MAG: hypothetical protein Pars2KO_31720 [Parasphingorhabdus sp.]